MILSWYYEILLKKMCFIPFIFTSTHFSLFFYLSRFSTTDRPRSRYCFHGILKLTHPLCQHVIRKERTICVLHQEPQASLAALLRANRWKCSAVH